MTHSAWWRRFLVKGVFWRQFLRWAVLNVPIWLEPILIGCWSLFFLLWGPGRRGVMANLSAILPGSWRVSNFFRTYLVFWNYAWTITDNMRFRELRVAPDWEFTGFEHFSRMESEPGGAILLTAHMGSYDLGAHLFTEFSTRKVVMIRAPEADPHTRQFEEESHGRTVGDALRVGFSTRASDLAFELLGAVREGEIVAIQGDRVTPGIASTQTSLFGRATELPTGPFALAMAARAAIYPMFVVRTGRRRYTLIATEPIALERTSRNRDEDLGRGIERWRDTLQSTIAGHWEQWFTFEPFSEELAS